MIFIIISLIIILIIINVLHIRRQNKNTPIRLKKQVTLVERFQNFIDRYYGYLFTLAIILAFILFVICIMAFIPGTESGVWYNGGVENVVS